jgi:hypothetical protein
METEDKSYWGTCILALLIVSLAFSTLVIFNPERAQHFKKRIEIKTNENVGEIVSAVENLGRKDISINIHDEWWGYGSTRFTRFLWASVGFFFLIGFLVGIYSVTFRLCRVLLKMATAEKL